MLTPCPYDPITLCPYHTNTMPLRSYHPLPLPCLYDPTTLSPYHANTIPTPCPYPTYTILTPYPYGPTTGGVDRDLEPFSHGGFPTGHYPCTCTNGTEVRFLRPQHFTHTPKAVTYRVRFIMCDYTPITPKAVTYRV